MAAKQKIAEKPKRAPAKKKQPAAVETSASIAEQTALFLKEGHKVDVIQSGISGQPTMAKPRDNSAARPAVVAVSK
jgi:hypothetical protein